MGRRWEGRKDVWHYFQSLFTRPLLIIIIFFVYYLGYTIVRWWHTVCDRLHIVHQGRALLGDRIRGPQIRSGWSVGASGTTLLSGRGRRCRCCRPHFRKWRSVSIWRGDGIEAVIRWDWLSGCVQFAGFNCVLLTNVKHVIQKARMRSCVYVLKCSKCLWVNQFQVPVICWTIYLWFQNIFQKCIGSSNLQ